MEAVSSDPQEKLKYEEQKEAALEGFNHDVAYHTPFPFLFDEEPQMPLSDHEDQVTRCPRCVWELEGGQCSHCGWHRGREISDLDNSDSYEGEGDDLENEFNEGVERVFEEIPTLSDEEFIDDATQESTESDYGGEFDVHGGMAPYPLVDNSPFFEEESDDDFMGNASDDDSGWGGANMVPAGSSGFPQPYGYSVRPPLALPQNDSNIASRVRRMAHNVPNTPPPAYSTPQYYHSASFPSAASTNRNRRAAPSSPSLNERQRRDIAMFSGAPSINTPPHGSREDAIDLRSPDHTMQPSRRLARNQRPSTTRLTPVPPATTTQATRAPARTTQATRTPARTRRQHTIVLSDESDRETPVPSQPTTTASSQDTRELGGRSRPIQLDDELLDLPGEITYGTAGYLEHDPNDRRPEVERYRSQVAYHTRGEDAVYRPTARPAFEESESEQEVTSVSRGAFNPDSDGEPDDDVGRTGIFSRIARRRGRHRQ